MDKPEVKAAVQPTFKVTLFRSRKTNLVLFVEAGKDFVDTLLSFLVLPIGTIINIVSQGMQEHSLGGISCIFESVDSSFVYLEKNHFVQSRPAVLGCTCTPRTCDVQFHHDLVKAKMMHPFNYPSPSLMYGCTSNICGLYSRKQGTPCGAHRACRSGQTYSAGPYAERMHNPTDTMDGFVKEDMKFIVTDELKIIPCSINTSMSLLKRLDITFVDDPESDEIIVSFTQIVELLHSALVSKQCLNDVFGKK